MWQLWGPGQGSVSLGKDREERAGQQTLWPADQRPLVGKPRRQPGHSCPGLSGRDWRGLGEAVSPTSTQTALRQFWWDSGCMISEARGVPGSFAISSFCCHCICKSGETLLLITLLLGFSSKGFPCGSAGKESAGNEGDLGSIPGLGRSPGEEKGYPLQCSGLENSINCVVCGVAKSRTRLRDFHFHFSSKAL